MCRGQRGRGNVDVGSTDDFENLRRERASANKTRLVSRTIGGGEIARQPPTLPGSAKFDNYESTPRPENEPVSDPVIATPPSESRYGASRSR